MCACCAHFIVCAHFWVAWSKTMARNKRMDENSSSRARGCKLSSSRFYDPEPDVLKQWFTPGLEPEEARSQRAPRPVWLGSLLAPFFTKDTTPRGAHAAHNFHLCAHAATPMNSFPASHSPKTIRQKWFFSHASCEYLEVRHLAVSHQLASRAYLEVRHFPLQTSFPVELRPRQGVAGKGFEDFLMIFWEFW